MFCPHFAGGILPLHRSDIPGKKTVGMAYILIVFNKTLLFNFFRCSFEMIEDASLI
jgi:hypothetical protein